MKKIVISMLFLILSVFAIGYWIIANNNNPLSGTFDDNAIYINVNSIKISSLYMNADKLAKAIQKNGRSVVLSDKNNFKSGKFNLYITEKVEDAPQIKDKTGINMLWVPTLKTDDKMKYVRQFDVVIVKNIPSFRFLKAINARTAYIPDAINVKKENNTAPNGKFMFYGEYSGFVLPLILAGNSSISVDVFGEGFEKVWPLREIKGVLPNANDFVRYSVVLIDQSEEDIRDEVLNKRIIETVEQGGLPFIRYNVGVSKIFGTAIPMYRSEEEFINGLARFRREANLVIHMRNELKKISKNWNTNSQAKKVIELFDLMEAKRI